MLGDRSFAARTAGEGAFGKLLIGVGCLYVLFAGLVVTGIGVGILAGIKYVSGGG